MQAIITKYLGPKNHRGARVKATAYSASKTYSYKYDLDAPQNHRAVAMALALELGWNGTLVGGELPDDTGYAFVIVIDPVTI